MTSKLDEPDEAFWDAYSREIHGKLAEVREKPSWWNKLLTFIHPWPVPALATALILVVALTLTFTNGMWRSQGTPPEEMTLLEILPVAENLEFFEAMEILDAMDLLEDVGGRQKRLGMRWRQRRGTNHTDNLFSLRLFASLLRHTQSGGAAGSRDAPAYGASGGVGDHQQPGAVNPDPKK